MRASNVEYHAPARFDDLLECFVRISRIGPDERRPTSARAYRLPDDALMVTATQTLVLVDREPPAADAASRRRPASRSGRSRATGETLGGAEVPRGRTTRDALREPCARRRRAGIGVPGSRS